MDNKCTKKVIRILLIVTVRYIFNCKARNLYFRSK